MKLIDTVKVILLDMNSTFMFGEDRFSENEDYYTTYQALGGSRLNARQVRKAITDTFAYHELGQVSDAYAVYLRKLASTHVLGLVANIWAPKDKWLLEFERTGINNVFTTLVFSSELGCIKPSPKIYQKALEGLRTPHSEVLFVGDSLRYDIEGAKNLGFNTVWINEPDANHPAADYIVPSLLHLDQLPAKSA